MKKNIGNRILRVGVLLFMVTATTLFINSCKEEDPTIPSGTGDNSIEVVFKATANGNDFNLNDSFDLTAEGFSYTFSLFKFYVSQVRLVKDDNSELVLKAIDMIDFRTDAPNLSFKVNVPAGNYKEIKMGIGVDSASNVQDPSTYPSSHPLALSKGTYWDMGTQYRFFLMEGRLDTTQNDSFDIPFVVHTGTNALYREKTFAKTLAFTKGDNKTVTFEIDVDALLSNINFKQNHVSHTMGGGFDLAEKVTDNLLGSISIE
jgi:hypothetical protein